jgi:XRE family transcriptional regulator, fatty acid utilization regulator
MARQAKLFAGVKVRAARERAGLTQTMFAKKLNISPAYLNQLESNQRPLTVTVLVEMNRQFGIDISAFSGDEEGRLYADLAEMLRDPIFAGDPLSPAEIKTAVGASPWMVKKLLELHTMYRTQIDRMLGVEHEFDGVNPSKVRAALPYEEVRDFFLYTNGYIDELEERAEHLVGELGTHEGRPMAALTDYIKAKHQLEVVVRADQAAKGGYFVKRVDNKLFIRPDAAPCSVAFALASHIALREHGDILDRTIATGKFQTPQAEALCRAALLNYFAGAVLMPYSTFQPAARSLRHDVERLSLRFGASLEQVMHRLSTLQRLGARGVPIYFAKVDVAGNIIKRHSANRFRFARFAGTCPVWSIQDAFRSPERFNVQVVEMPDNVKYLSIARVVSRRASQFGTSPRKYVLCIGCEIDAAKEFVYGDGIDLKTVAAAQIGVSCRICERRECDHRAAPPIDAKIVVDPNKRSALAYEVVDHVSPILPEVRTRKPS